MLGAEGSKPFGSLCGAALGTDDNLTALPSLTLIICVLYPSKCQRPLQHTGLQGRSRWGHEQGCAQVPVPSCHSSQGQGMRGTRGGTAWDWQRWVILLEHLEPVTAEQ